MLQKIKILLACLNLLNIINISQGQNIQTIEDTQCPIVMCSSDLQDSKYCYKQDLQDPNVIHLKDCGSEELYCNSEMNQCQEDAYQIMLNKTTGQQCEFDFQCLSNECLNSKCMPQFNLICYSDLDCNIGEFCDNTDTQQCQAQLDEGRFCSKDFQCQNNLACNLNQCIRYGSLELYEQADNSLACKSGFAGYISHNTNQLNELNDISQSDQDSICLPTPKLVNQQSPSYQCQSPQDSCVYQSSQFNEQITQLNNQQTLYSQFEIQCQCGYSYLGNSFCPHIFTNDYTALLYEVTSKLSLDKCHTLDRINIYECLMQNAESDDKNLLNQFIIEHYQREKNNQVRENDKCMRKNSKTSQYWEAFQGKDFNNNNMQQTLKSSSSNILMKPSFILLIICYLLLAFLNYK